MNTTNKTLAAFLALAIVVSVAGTIISLNKIGKLEPIPTGRASASQTGTVSLTVSAQASVITTTNVSFGSSAVQATTVITTMTVNPGDFVDCGDDRANATTCGGITLRNDGNVNVNISMNASSNAAALIAGTSPVFNYKLANGNTSNASAFVDYWLPGCQSFGSACNSSSTNWTGISADNCQVTTTSRAICTNLTWEDTNDSMRVEFNLTIPADATRGAKTMTLEFFFEQA